MSSDESEYETAEEGDEEDDALTDYGFVLYVAEDGTHWFLPMYYRPEMDLLPTDCVGL